MKFKIAVIDPNALAAFGLKNILYDLFINQRDRKTGKQFKKEFHEMMRNSYPYEYIMYSFFSSKIPENSS